MQTQNTILHSDMNAFYASVEMMLDPSLRGKAVAVCGSTESRHGIVLAKSELAKKAGVQTGMVNWQARQKCPDLILVPPQYDQYLKYSNLVHEIYYRYSNFVEPFGMDECWVGLPGTDIVRGRAIAEEIRTAAKEELGLTVSIGVSFSKIFAKLGSDMKKPDAITVISTDDVQAKVWPLPVSDLLYVGRATDARLQEYGVRTIGELASLDPEMLRRWFGINGVKLWHFANGTDLSRVMPVGFVSPVKSIGHGITCCADLENEDEVFKVILELSQDVGHRLRVHKLAATGVQLYVRENNMDGVQYQCRLPIKTQLPNEIASAAFLLFQERFRWVNNVRAVCVRAIELVSCDLPDQLSFFIDHEKRDRRERLEDAVESIRSRFGKRSLTYAVLMGDLKMPDDGRELVRMPDVMYQ